MGEQHRTRFAITPDLGYNTSPSPHFSLLTPPPKPDRLSLNFSFNLLTPLHFFLGGFEGFYTVDSAAKVPHARIDPPAPMSCLTRLGTCEKDFKMPMGPRVAFLRGLPSWARSMMDYMSLEGRRYLPITSSTCFSANSRIPPGLANACNILGHH